MRRRTRGATAGLAGATAVALVLGLGLGVSQPYAAGGPVPGAAPLPVAAAAPDVTAGVEAIVDPSSVSAYSVLLNGQLLVEGGDLDTRTNVNSVRKSALSALFGIAAERGLIRLDATLAELDIDDARNPLTETERSATVLDLLSARSGVYVPTDAESPELTKIKPARGQYRPGEHWFYNNWDFNTLGVIFDRYAGTTMGQAFDEWIARPLGMRMFRPQDVVYTPGANSAMPVYSFYMTADDLGRFGALYADGGRWGGRQIVPAQWVERSLRPVSETEPSDRASGLDGYGLLWWADTAHDLEFAYGFGGQYVLVDRGRKLTVVVTNDLASSLLQRAVETAFGSAVSIEVPRAVHAYVVDRLGLPPVRTG